MKIIVTIIPTDSVTNSLLFSFCPFFQTKKQELGFQQVDGLVTRNIFAFYLQRVGLYFKAMPNSINFYKGISLHVISVRIIVPCISTYECYVTCKVILGSVLCIFRHIWALFKSIFTTYSETSLSLVCSECWHIQKFDDI